MADEIIELVSLTSFLSFKYGNTIESLLKDSYLALNLKDIQNIKKLMNTYQNKLDELKELSKKLDTGQITESNLGAAESHVQDIATAEEFVNRTKKSIISEAKVAMLSQANKKPEQVINLLE